MTDFERDLRDALKRREPRHDMADRVMARIGVPAARPRFYWRPLLAAAAAVVVLMGGIEQYREYQKGQEAKQQLMLALEITAQKLSVAQEKVNEVGRRRIGDDQ